jgi:hypothetical protein
MARKQKAGDAGTTLVTFLLDRTGSMQMIKQDTIGAFNAYLDTLAAGTADIKFTLLQFDSISLDKVCVEVPAPEAPRLNSDNYEPRASTPLIDAAVKTIRAIEQSLADKPKDTKVVVCIQTDGEENCSREHTWEQLNDLIKEKTEAGWQFNFMGASIDAYKQAQRMGIAVGQTMSYDSKDARATQVAFMANARNTLSFASGMSCSTSYSTDQKQAAGDAFDPAAKAKRNQKAKKPIVDDLTL